MEMKKTETTDAAPAKDEQSDTATTAPAKQPRGKTFEQRGTEKQG